MKTRWELLFVAWTVLTVNTWAEAYPTDPPELPPVVSVDTVPMFQLFQLIDDGYTEEISWEDAHGEFVDVHTYIPDVTVDQAWAYLESIYNLPEWTMSVRDVEQIDDLDGMPRYMATENLPPYGNIYFLEEKHPEKHMVDWWVGHSPDYIWMRYSMRILDAQEYMGKPGVLFTWVNFGHENFWSDPILMQGFLQMKPAHGLEQENFSKILQYRAAGNTEPLTLDKMAELGVINASLMAPQELWELLAQGVTPTVPWEEQYGDFIGSHTFLPFASDEVVASYVLNPDNLEDWTVSLRPFHFGGDESFIGIERLSPFGLVRGKTDIHSDSNTMDLRMSPVRVDPSGQRLIMNSTIRILDGMETIGREGTVIYWISYRNEAYKGDWLFEQYYWKYLPVRNDYGTNNIGVFTGAW